MRKDPFYVFMAVCSVALIFVATVAIADVKLKNAGSTIGPVIDFDCTADGGLTCARASATATGGLTCTPASATDRGCISMAAQSMGQGAKNFSSSVGVDGGLAVKDNVQASAYKATSTTQQFIGPTRSADAGIAYLELGGATGMGAFPSSPGITASDGVSFPQVATISGYLPALGRSTDRVVQGVTFNARAQFLRLATTVMVSGNADAGVSSDGGSQTFYVEVYNVTTGATLCVGSLRPCGLDSGYVTDTCGGDGGAWVAVSDVIQLRANTFDCLVSPSMNVVGEYAGPLRNP